MTWSLKTLTIGFVYVNTNAQWVVAYKAMPIKCFVSYCPVSCDGGWVGRAKKKKKKNENFLCSSLLLHIKSHV